MIRGRKEGTNYATWFIGFDHDDTFGLPAFPELPAQSPRTPVQNKPVSRATSSESLLPVGQSKDSQTICKSLTPAGTQTTTQFSHPISTQTTEETSTQTPEQVSRQISTHFSKPFSTQTTEATSTQTPNQVFTQTTTHTSTEVSTETFDHPDVRRSRTPTQNHTRPKSQDFDAHPSRRRKEKDTQGLYKEAFHGAKKSEEFKFRVKFDKLVSDLHVAIEEKTQNGRTSFASPSYGEVMLTFKEKVKDLLKGFSQRLQLAYESFGPEDSPDNTGQKVKQNVSRFIEGLIGENLDLTSDEAVSDLSSLSDDSTSDQNSFEDLIAQAVVSKLFENRQKEVNETVHSSDHHSAKKSNLRDRGTDAEEIRRLQSDSSTSYDYIERNQNFEDDIDRLDNSNRENRKQHKKNDSRTYNGGRLSNPDIFNYKSNLIPDDTQDESDGLDFQSGINKVNNEIINKTDYKRETSHFINGTAEHNEINSAEIQNGISDEETDIVKEFELLKEFVKKTRITALRKVEAVPFDDSGLYEVNEETLKKTNIDRDEEREEFHTRYSVFDHINNWEQPLPDFSQFDNIDFASDEIDPDLLSMNLAIIPEETEEELEQEEEDDEQNRWKVNWLFQGKGVSPYGNMGKRTVNVNDEGSLYMMVPKPDARYAPRIGHRDIDQLSDFSEHDLLGRTDLDGSDDEENTFYANTSKELARISGRRKQSNNSQRLSSGSLSDNSDLDSSPARSKAHRLYGRATLDDVDSIHIPGPIVEPSRQELKLLQDLVQAENDDPKFVVAPESVTVQEGEPVKFTCRVAGTVPVDVFWYREGDEVEELDESEDVEISINGDKHSIVLYNTSKKLAGQYMCIALNDKGKAIQYLVVTVKDNKQELKKPEFLKGLKDVEVTEGQSVKFRVKVKGFPPPRISWYKDGELLKSTKTCRIEKFGNRDYILTIDYASMNDDAEYTVSARNVAGEERMSAQVIVEPQSDMPARKQRVSSNTTSGASDSDSDRSTPRRSLKSTAGSTLYTSLPTSFKGSVQDREDQLQINQLDRKVNMTQMKLETEAEKMRGVAEKLLSITCNLDKMEDKLATLEAIFPSIAKLGIGWADNSRNLWIDVNTVNDLDAVSEKRRLITADTLDVLRAADEIIQHEKSAAQHPSHKTVNGDGPSPPVKDFTHREEISSTISSTQDLNSDNLIKDLVLPDTLDEFPLPNLVSTKSTPVISALELTLSERNQQNNFSDRISSIPVTLKSEGNIENSKTELSKPVASSRSNLRNNQNETNLINISSHTGRGSALSVPSSGLTDTSSEESEQMESELINSRQQLLREQYSRDFEIPQMTEKKRWSVTLDSFSPQAEVVNKQKTANEETSNIEISVTDLSQSFTIRSLKGDNSSQPSSRRQSTDSGVSVSSKHKRPAPVHMVGHTTEEEVPESRTEFNTDGSIELPSVNRLKAMFSTMQDDDLGNGTFKRIHSITARNVPKDQLEKLRASNQNETSPLSGNFLEVPGSSSSSFSTTLQPNSNSSLSLTSSNSSSKFTSAPTQLSVDSVSTHQQKTFQVPPAGPFKDLDPDKDPVLIYPDTDPEYMQRHRSPSLTGDVITLTKSTRAPLPPQQNQQQHINQTSTTATTKVTLSSKNPLHQPQTKLLVRRAVTNDENENIKKSGPRIRSGCISARAAFWERRIVDGGVADDEEFPEMVEDGDT